MFIRPPLRKGKHKLEICQKLVNSSNTWCIVFNMQFCEFFLCDHCNFFPSEKFNKFPIHIYGTNCKKLIMK